MRKNPIEFKVIELESKDDYFQIKQNDPFYYFLKQFDTIEDLISNIEQGNYTDIVVYHFSDNDNFGYTRTDLNAWI